MQPAKHVVTIKGTKEGLIFLLDDECPMEEIMSELQLKLEKTHHQILTGPQVQVHIKLGKRIVSEEEEAVIKEMIGRHENLLIRSFESESEPEAKSSTRKLKMLRGMIRSGQTLYVEGDLMLIGDVNPGGSISATGHIYVLGALRGMAHAGCEGDEDAIIAASFLRPTQLRIASVISRPPDEWGIDDAYMEFAYLQDSKMEIDKLVHLHRIRPGVWDFVEE